VIAKKKDREWQPTFLPPSLRSNEWVLPITISAAVFAHALAFYLIQASVPAGGKKVISSAHLSVLDPSNPRDHSALGWIEDRDPAAIVSQGAPPSPLDVFATAIYQPSFEKNLPEPLPIQREQSTRLHQTLFPPGTVPLPQSSLGNAPRQSPHLICKIEAGPALQITITGVFSPPKVQKEIPTPLSLLVVQAAEPDSKFLFLLRSSGNDSLDQYALAWLETAKITFPGSQSSGWVTIHWGADIWEKAVP
jgi:hypothetical protein